MLPPHGHAGTNYIETLRVQVHANCRVRRIYFSDRLYSEEELPPEFKLFLPIVSYCFKDFCLIFESKYSDLVVTMCYGNIDLISCII